MAKKKSAAPKHVEPEEESQELPEEEPEADEKEGDEPAANGPASPAMSKADACHAALAAGIETAERAMEFTRSKFGVEIKATDFTLYKSKQKKQGGAAPKGKPGRKPKPAPSQAVEGYLAPPPKPSTNGEADLIEAMEALKPLIAQHGAERVKRLVDLLG